jgi:hypothetical protein
LPKLLRRFALVIHSLSIPLGVNPYPLRDWWGMQNRQGASKEEEEGAIIF